MFVAFFHHADTESYATIKRSIDFHITAYEGRGKTSGYRKNPERETSGVPPTRGKTFGGEHVQGENVLHPCIQTGLGARIIWPCQFRLDFRLHITSQNTHFEATDLNITKRN